MLCPNLGFAPTPNWGKLRYPNLDINFDDSDIETWDNLVPQLDYLPQFNICFTSHMSFFIRHAARFSPFFLAIFVITRAPNFDPKFGYPTRPDPKFRVRLDQ